MFLWINFPKMWKKSQISEWRKTHKIPSRLWVSWLFQPRKTPSFAVFFCWGPIPVNVGGDSSPLKLSVSWGLLFQSSESLVFLVLSGL